MKATVGLRSYPAIFRPQLIKRDALMFGRIGLLGCNNINDAKGNLLDSPFRDLPWLMEQGIVFDPQPAVDYILGTDDAIDEDTRKALNAMKEILRKFKQVLRDKSKIDIYLYARHTKMWSGR